MNVIAYMICVCNYMEFQNLTGFPFYFLTDFPTYSITTSPIEDALQTENATQTQTENTTQTQTENTILGKLKYRYISPCICYEMSDINSDGEQCSRYSTDHMCLPLTVLQRGVLQNGGKRKDRYIIITCLYSCK